MKTLNIFTDASIYEDKENSRYIGCSGAIAVEIGVGIMDEKYEILDEHINCTNNRAELIGILLGLELGNKYRYLYDDIYIYSDSKISIFTIREWSYKWINEAWNRFKYTNEFEVRNTAGPVKNMDIIANIIDYIVYNNLNIHLMHVKGHANNDKDLIHAKDVFKKSNGIDISNEDMYTISHYNNEVDNMTRKFLQLYLEDKQSASFMEHRYPTPFIKIPTRDTMNKLRQLI